MASRPRHTRGFTLIELAVVVVIVALLAGALLKRALYYQEQAERVSVEQTVGVLRSAMHMQMAYSLLHPTVSPMAKLAGANPMNWLAEVPGNYVGEYAAPKQGEIARGSWYFDTVDRTLVYLPSYDDQLQTAPGENGKIRFRTRLSTNNSVGYGQPNTALDSTFEGVVLEPVKPYKWR
ncbi:MAG TPA: prepilin-type N-terminal cleavage/methylation domain-containing protein [Burkholderiaceae bacterium]